ncbi:E3 ubiquitin-protein ligase Bre1 isoform X2 [Bombus vosnesenskii]|uniref:E3 ubiquitin protein ligase n=2 Tax=Pyrobombus TaxID=144703 RepID=A0A6J3KMI2_9HYME|nr:E3 ubiquitin-protein ligase Bre1 isoform X2 [Bombus vancouverensis nearcticus]XP_033302694.1 E3 ubiquitin-protein ligase Bre1 isoform X2 [Bombus bifarius]XP_033354210.1 E3 ubiquitin-protein ligase Bre1 isoform X2 [Bombus vosnesenskii]XP_050473159.1 E3 ubiquitin-protein ligase Bre1 isoform X2 [Bombus huntii]
MSKRPVDSGDSGSQPPIKKVQFEPILIGPISTLEEMDMKVLQFQNKKLAQRLEQRHRVEAELRQRIEQLEKRQMQDDAVLNVVNRYWNQLNEDIRVLLQRFDAETADESENKNESEATTSFLMQLSSWDKEELDDKLANRVQVSKRAVSKVVQAFDRLSQRNEKITLALKGEFDGEEAPNIDEVVRRANSEIQMENRNLQAINIQLHEKYHTISLKMSELQDTITGKDTLAAELRNQVDDLQYELNKVRARNDKLEHHLGEAIEKLKAFQQIHGTDEKGSNKPNTLVASSVSQTKLEDLQRELEETRELANNRLQELDKLHQQHRDALKEVEKLKMDIRQLPESVIVETTEYKCLQSQFSVLYNESMQLKTQLDDARQQLQSSKNAHLRHIEMMESEELMAQKKLRGECIQLEDVLAQLRKEYEMLRIEFEQNLAANEQTGPINREMRHLITSLQNHNQQLKGEVHRYKRKYKEASSEIPKLKKEIEELTTKLGQQTSQENKEGNNSDGSGKEEDASNSLPGSAQIKEESGVSIKRESGEEEVETIEVGEGEGNKGTPDSLTLTSPTLKKEKDIKREKDIKKEAVKTEHRDPAHRAKDTKVAESELVRDLKAQLKKAVNEMKEMKLLLDMYKGVGKEQRDKVQLMAAERKTRAELDELRQQIKKIQESKREERKKLADEDAQIKIKKLEEQAYTLQRQVASQKQEEEALLNEMEVTGQAFEDMQEQNSRLIQQLREKDDANFKLMTERIKSNQLHKLAREEKDVLKEQVSTLTTQVEAANVVVRKLEEKERLLQNSLATVEKELALRQQAMEMHKRKAIESAQSAADLKLHLEKYHSQMKEAQQVVAEKTSSLEAEAYKTKRLQEEIAQLRRKVERMKKIELAETLDEVMAEELREYKETLTCPSCKVKRKDAVLTKCFHVFCWDCLRTRYETRQRKCPKCNCAFGANDYHRLYLST